MGVGEVGFSSLHGLYTGVETDLGWAVNAIQLSGVFGDTLFLWVLMLCC